MIKHVRWLFDIPEHLRNTLDDYIRKELSDGMSEVIRWYLERDPDVFTFTNQLPIAYRNALKDIVESIENFEIYFTGEYELENIFCDVEGDIIVLELTYVIDTDDYGSEEI